MSDMYRSIVGMFDPLSGNNIKVDVSPCIPHPHEPDWGIYQEIGKERLESNILSLSLLHITLVCNIKIKSAYYVDMMRWLSVKRHTNNQTNYLKVTTF